MSEKDNRVLKSDEEHEIRVGKVKEMSNEKISAWPQNKPVSDTCSSTIDLYLKNPESEIEVSLAGRLVLMREHGKTIFANIQDRSGKIQIYLRKDLLGEDEFNKLKKYIDLGDIVWCTGTLFKTKMGEITLRVKQVVLVSKCLHPLPEKFHGLADVEQRYRQRYLDLISNEQSREKFKIRSKAIQSIRNFLLENDFLEVETPMLQPIPGGALARPFVTHHNAYDMDLYLRIAPELYLKRLVVGGFERVFEINRSFRNEGVSTKHNPEFTMLEFYIAYEDYKKGMELTENLIQKVVKENFDSLEITFGDEKINFKAPFRRLTIEDSLKEVGGLSEEQISQENIDKTIKEKKLELPKGKNSYGEKLFFLFEEFVEGKLIQPTFIINFPIEVSPLSKRSEENPAIVDRFELFVCGMEFANGFTELNDPFDQAERFKKQAESKQAGDDEAHYYDADYIKALEYGLPPTVGVGVGLDRLVMILTNTSSIKDVILFPTMKHIK